jgi:chromosome segregation protein
VFLKSLVMRGFKSFAERTTLHFEPGITVVVGPNGSGKSNVVDALAWVLGTRSAKLLRGGELADVIFAGSPARPPLGRATVEISIDNSSGHLDSPYGEIVISREILPTGENVYGLNGAPCRLLDIEELLSDSGLGRELHTVIGQGQLDQILQGKPEDRRAFIEEAAGILKHRRRRERAERKLAHVDEHLDRLQAVLRELGRQLRPLERQAEAASKHAGLEAELRDVRVRLLAHDLAHLTGRIEEAEAGDRDSAGRLRGAQEEEGAVTARVEQLEEELRAGAPVLEEARETVERLLRLRERLAGTADLVEARRRHLIEFVEEPLAGRPPAELRAQAGRLGDERATRQESTDRRVSTSCRL